MRSTFVALILSSMLTVEQRDAFRHTVDDPSAVVSGDGQFVAFVTYSPLAQADTDRLSDIYVLDRAEQRVSLESVDVPGLIPASAGRPAISHDGRLLVYETHGGVVLRDRRSNVTTVLGQGRQPMISGDGRTVVFTASTSDRLTDADVNGERSDIYAIDLHSRDIQRVSVDLQGLDPASASSVSPGISADGRYIVFASRPPTEGKWLIPPSRIFIRDIVLGTTTAMAPGWDPVISEDGQYVAFVASKGNLPQVFLKDLRTGTTQLVSRNLRGGLPNGASSNPTMSSNGRFVAFQSEASNMVTTEDFNLLWDVFVFDRVGAATTRVSGDPEGIWMEPSAGPSIDASGGTVAFSSRHPTNAADKANDFDLYVATISSPLVQRR